MPGLAILCPGQGKQDATLFERLPQYPEAQATLHRLRAAGILPDKIIAWLETSVIDPDEIHQNDIAQPAICLYQMLAWAVLKPVLPLADIFLGYSLGELSAYGCAGVFTPEDLVRLAAIRGRLMTDAATAPQTLVAVIGLKRKRMEMVCAESGGRIAIVNGVDHFIAGLLFENTKPFIDACEKAGATKTVTLPVTVAAHTVWMSAAASNFRKTLSTVAFHPAIGDILSGVSGERAVSRDQMIEALSGQIHHTIEWQVCMENAVARGCRVFLELGPGDSLSRMALTMFPGVEARSITEFRDLRAVPRWVNAALAR